MAPGLALRVPELPSSPPPREPMTVSPDAHHQPASTPTQDFSSADPQEWGPTAQAAANCFPSPQCVWGSLPSSLRAACSTWQVPHFKHTPTYVRPPTGGCFDCFGYLVKDTAAADRHACGSVYQALPDMGLLEAR